MRNWRAGFALIELLVALAVIAILLAIAVPAIQSAREMARKTQCQNRLKQVGVALQNHQSQFGHLPEDGQNGYGFGVFLLPQLDQAPLYERLDPLRKKLPDPSHARPELEGLVLKVFRCASDTSSDRLEPSGFARSNYLGTKELFSEATSLSDVLDGESQTIVVGETMTEHAWALPGTGSSDAVPNSGGDFSSPHSGGAFFLLCDGSVRFISDSIDQETFHALCTPAGRETVGKF